MKNSIEIYFDGGCRPTNPGNKYGSWSVSLDGREVFKASRIELGWGTNNEAEFDALIQALQWTVDELLNGGFAPESYHIAMFTDSTIVRNRIRDRRTTVGKTRNPKSLDVSQRMSRLTRECLSRLTLFKLWTIEWKGRDSNVERFGH